MRTSPFLVALCFAVVGFDATAGHAQPFAVEFSGCAESIGVYLAPTGNVLAITPPEFIPVGIGTGLLLSGRGSDEGLRFDIGLATIAVGSIAGPTVGQLYGQGGWDTLVSFLLRLITGAVMTVGIGIDIRGGEDVKSAGLAMAIVGGIPTGLLAIYDVWAAQDSAKEAKYREGHALIDAPTQRAELASCGL